MILERIKGERFSRVLPLWTDFAAVILAGGPSLTREQVEQVRLAREEDLARVVVVNDSYLLAPWADLHYAADAKWHRWHAAGVAKPILGLTAEQVRDRWRAFAGERCSIQASEEVVDPGVHLLKNAHHPSNGFGLSLDRGALATGRHSGFQALNLVILAGCKTVILLGFDGQPGPDGKSHWHGDHPKPSPNSVYQHFLRSFSAAEREIEAAGVSVLNCSPGTAINSFPKVPLAKALEALK